MSLGNAMWDIFRHTGDISAYLVYKDCLECQKKKIIWLLIRLKKTGDTLQGRKSWRKKLSKPKLLC